MNRFMSFIVSHHILLHLSLIALLLGATGCRTHFSVASPAPPLLPGSTSGGTIDTTKSISVTQVYNTKNYSDDLNDYTAAVKASLTDPSQLPKAKQARNNIIWGQMGAIERVYTVYHTRLFSDKNQLAIGSDSLTLGLTAASSIAGNAATKTVLSSLGTAFTGLGLSIDKNYFGQQSFQILGLAMQTRRDKVRAAIASNLEYCDVATYPLLQAQRDLIQYFSAGTLDSALQELQEEAGTATAAASSGGTTPGAIQATAPAPVTTCQFASPPPAPAPVFNPTAGQYSLPQSVSISDTAPGAIIYYTTNGSVPTTSSQVYKAPITMSSTGTIQAIATANGYAASSPASATFTLMAANPAFSPPAGQYTGPQSVALSDATPAATIYYTTDGTAPTTSSTVYSSPIAISSTTTIKATAVAAGYGDSAPAAATYTISPNGAAVPAFSPPGGQYSATQTVTLSDTTPGATIYYTLDGTSPTTSSLLYSAAIVVSSTTTIKAIATANGYAASAVGAATYTIQPNLAATPNFNPTAGQYPTAQAVTISDVTPGAAIYYTLDGTLPTTSSPSYSAAIVISSTTTIKAIAAAAGYAASAVGEATYTITRAASRPALTPH